MLMIVSQLQVRLSYQCSFLTALKCGIDFVGHFFICKISFYLFLYCVSNFFSVSESMEAIDNPLHEAAKRGNLPFLQECLANGVSVNGLDKSGATPLYWAAHGGHSDCVQALLSVSNISFDSQVSIYILMHMLTMFA